MKKINYKKKVARITHSLLSSWYDEERANVEISQYLPGASSLKEEMRKLMEKTFTPDRFHLADLKNEWETITGKAVAKYSRPHSIKNKILYIEVFRSVFIRDLSIPQTKAMIIGKVNEHFQQEVCSDLKFMPYGK